MDGLHEIAEEDGISWKEARVKFNELGCKAFDGGSHSAMTDRRTDTALASAMLFDLLGDDIDGIAAMMEDMEFAYGGDW